MARALLLQTRRENLKKYIVLLPEAEPKAYQQAIKKRKGSRQKTRGARVMLPVDPTGRTTR